MTASNRTICASSLVLMTWEVNVRNYSYTLHRYAYNVTSRS